MSLTNSNDSIVIVGAGIIGLNVALVLAQKGYGRSVTVVAEHLPGDTSINYTSPWAGCNFSAISGTDANALRWDELGYAHLSQLATQCPDESYVQWAPSVELWDEKVPRDKIQHMSTYLKNFRVLTEDELPGGVNFAVSFTTLAINAPEHIKYLQHRLQTQHGVRFIRQKLSSITEGFLGPATKVVFNCTGLAAQTFPGVEDSKCFPTRGQVVLAKGSQIRTNMMRHGADYETYIIPRPGSNGNVILGGYMQKGSGDGSTYAFEVDSILTRTRNLSPEIRQQTPEILAAFAGLRPSREGGARIEREDLDVNGQKRVLVHNYGAGGTGFQAGYGMASEAVSKAEDVLREMKGSFIEARL